MQSTFKLTIEGNKSEAKQKVLALAKLATHLTGRELETLAGFIESGDPNQVALAKQYLGL